MLSAISGKIGKAPEQLAKIPFTVTLSGAEDVASDAGAPTSTTPSAKATSSSTPVDRP